LFFQRKTAAPFLTIASILTLGLFFTACGGSSDSQGFSKTGKFEWKSFLDDIVTQMLRSQIQQTMAGLFQMPSLGGSGGSAGAVGGLISGGGIGGGSSSSSSGGIFGGLGDLAGDVVDGIGDFFGGFFATGGNLSRGKFGVVGEAGPELISGPATVTPLGGGGSQQVTYNINAVDAQSFKQMIARDPKFLFAVTEEGRRNLPQYR